MNKVGMIALVFTIVVLAVLVVGFKIPALIEAKNNLDEANSKVLVTEDSQKIDKQQCETADRDSEYYKMICVKFQ